MLKEITIIVVCLGVVAQSLPVIVFYPQPSDGIAKPRIPLKSPEDLQGKGADEDFKNQLELILRDILNEPESLQNKITNPNTNANDENLPVGSELERRQHWSQGFLPGGK